MTDNVRSVGLGGVRYGNNAVRHADSTRLFWTLDPERLLHLQVCASFPTLATVKYSRL